jgi:hypothetical protein
MIFLAVIAALWLSGRIILRNQITVDRSLRLFLWLVLGALFLAPLVDLVCYLRDFVLLAIPSDGTIGEVQLFLGTILWSLYASIWIMIAVITYSSGIAFGRKLIDERRLPVIRDLSLGSLEKSFMVLGLAGLFSQMIRSTILNFASIYIPNPGEPFAGGYVGSLAGLVILAILLRRMDQRLGSQRQGRRRLPRPELR